MLRLLSSLLGWRRAVAALVVGGGALLATTIGVSAQSVLVATWTGSSTVSGCSYGGGPIDKFSCSSATGTASSNCTYQLGSSISGICAANLTANIVNATFVTQTSDITVAEKRVVAVHDFCWHGVGTLDGLGYVTFYPVTGGQFQVPPVNVQLHITTKGYTVFSGGQFVADQSLPVTVTYSGTGVNVGTGNLVSVSGTFSFYCGFGTSAHPAKPGAYAGQLSGVV